MSQRTTPPQTLDLTPLLPYIPKVLFTILAIVSIWLTTRLLRVLHPAYRSKPPPRKRGAPTRLLIVLGSGGHTAEMFAMLRRMGREGLKDYTHRSYAISAGDNFSVGWAKKFEEEVMGVKPPPLVQNEPAAKAALAQKKEETQSKPPAEPKDTKTKKEKSTMGESWLDVAHSALEDGGYTDPNSPSEATRTTSKPEKPTSGGTYDISFLPRARRIHQSIWTTPFTALHTLISALPLLSAPHTLNTALSARAHFADEYAKFSASLGRAKAGSLHAAAAQLKLEDTLQYLDASPLSNLPDDLAKTAGYGMPSVVLTNGPATGAVVVLAAVVLRLLNWRAAESKGLGRTVYVESWARCRKVSLAGRVIGRIVDRFLVQWEELLGAARGKAEFVGWVV